MRMIVGIAIFTAIALGVLKRLNIDWPETLAVLDKLREQQ